MTTEAGTRDLSAEQISLWSLQETDRENPSYVVPSAYRVTGPLSAELVEAAWHQLIRAHAVLRTRLRLVAGELTADTITADATGFTIGTSRLGGPDDIPGWLMTESARVFKLDSDLPVRVALAEVAKDDHVLLVCVHHIAVDGWSLDQLRREFWRRYESFASGGSVSCGPAGDDYRDYASWQRSAEGRRTAADDLAYWREELADLEVATIRRTRRDPVVPDWAGQEHCFAIPADTAAALRAVAERNSSTLYCVLLTAWQVLAGRQARARAVSTGIPVLGRTGDRWFDVIGNFANIVPIRSRLDEDRPFPDLLRDTGAAVLRAVEHQAARYEDIVRQVRSGAPGGTPGGTALFQAVFSMEQTTVPAAVAGLTVRQVRFPERFAKYDISAEVTEGTEGTGTGLRCRLVFRTKYLDERTVARLGAHYAELLRSVARASQAPVRTLSSVPARERRAIRDLTSVTPAGATLIHRAFETCAREFPDAIAVTARESMTYRELNERANRLARYLRSKGVTRETPVGISVERGSGLIEAMLAILKCGGCYVPLDPSSPAERVRSMVSDAGLGFVVADAGPRARYAAAFAGLRVIDTRNPDLAREAGHDLDLAGDPGDAAYVIFTSGSTGRPKGVCVTHANVTRLLAASSREFDFRPDDVWSMFHSYAFDFSVWEMYGALLSGARLVVVPAESARNPEEFLDLLAREGVTMLSQTPTAFGSLIEALRQAGDAVPRLRLRYIVFGGERIDPVRLAPWAGLMGDAGPALINMYGITETTVHVTFRRLNDADLARPAACPIGRPLSDLTMYILDDDQRLAGIGVPGEIYVGGAGLARGYVNSPELTAARFVPNPFGGPGERLYRTGDLALIGEDGEFEFIGRADQQVKIRGHRIELGEIEAAIGAHAGVEKVVVIPRSTEDGGTQLIAYYTAVQDRPGSAGAVPEPARIRDHTAGLLPPYMTPAWFVPVPGFPLTSSGKLDVRRLPAPDTAAPREPDGQSASATPLAARLAATWKRVLKLENVGPAESFFDIGGDSIRAVALVGALRDQGIAVSVSDIFAARNVGRLAALITRRASGAPEFVPVPPFALLTDADRTLLPGGVEDAYPLSMTQAGMVYEMLADSDSLRYHNVSSFRITDDQPLSPRCLTEAVRLVTGRHQILRSRVDLETYSEPIQLIEPAAAVEVHVEHLDDLAPDAVHDRVRAYMEQERSRPFDLARAPLFRIFAHACAENTWWLGLTDCHVILEGWSLHSFLMEVLRTYRELRDTGSASEHAPPAFRFADHIAQEAQAVLDAGSRGYWKHVIESYPKLTIPRPVTPARDGQYELSFSFAGHAAALRAIAREADVPLKSVLHAIHLKAMSVAFGQAEFYSGLVCDARPEVTGADRVLGMYLNTVPFGIRCADQAWVEFVADVFRREVELWPYRQFPLAELQAEMATRGARLIDSFFIYLDFHVVDYDLIDYDRAIDMSPTEFGLAVIAQNGTFTLKTRESVLERARARELMEIYRLVTEHLVRDPRSRAGLIGAGPLPLASGVRADSDAYAAGPAAQATAHGGGRRTTSVPARLAALWADLLDVTDVQPHDDFFELGGNSMRAIRLRSAIQREFNVKVPLRLILERRSVAAIAAHIDAAFTDPAFIDAAFSETVLSEDGDLIWLADGPATRPAFCFHPIGGSSHWYGALAGRLSADVRLAGFDPKSMLASVPEGGTIADVAAPYQTLIARACAGRPVSLVGWSAAASLTWEVAAGMERLGHQTSVLLIDPVAGDARILASQTQVALARIEIALARRDDSALRHALDSFGVPWHAGAAGYAADMLRVWKVLGSAMLGYRYGPRHGRTSIVTSADCHSGRHALMGGAAYADYLSTWRAACVPGLDEHQLPGDHTSVLAEPDVARIAAIFRDLTKQPG